MSCRPPEGPDCCEVVAWLLAAKQLCPLLQMVSQHLDTSTLHCPADPTWCLLGVRCVLLQLLLRVQPKRWLQLMIAPLGGSLDVLGRSLTPVRGGRWLQQIATSYSRVCAWPVALARTSIPSARTHAHRHTQHNAQTHTHQSA